MVRGDRHAHQNRRRRRVATLIFTSAILIVAAVIATVVVSQNLLGSEPTNSSGSTDAASESGSGESVSSEKVYREAAVDFPDTLNPLLAQTNSELSVSELLYRGLLKTDSNGDPQPDLASDWNVSDDGLRYTLELSADETWHDGEPVTVDDVLYTISLITDPEFPGDSSLSRFWRAITVSGEGERTIEFELLEPYVGFANYLTVPILPEHVFGGLLPTDLGDPDLMERAIGTGPYELDEIDEEAETISLSAADGAVGEDGFSNLEFSYFENRDDAMSAFREGEAEGLSYIPLEALGQEGTLPSDAKVFAPALSSHTALYFNLRHPQFQDAETRRAIEFAIDRDAIVETVLDGQAIPGTSPIPSMLSAHNPGEHAGFDRERASEMLESAGWSQGDDGVMQRDGERFVLQMVVNGEDQQRMAVASMMQEQLGEVGIQVEIQALSGSEVQEALNSRRFGAALYGWHTENGDPDCYQMWHSSQADQGLNFTGFSDPEADELLVQARQAVSLEERNERYATFQQIFAEQVPAVVVFYPRYHFAVSESVDGAEPWPLVNPSDRVRQIPDWTVGNSQSNEARVEDQEVTGQGEAGTILKFG